MANWTLKCVFIEFWNEDKSLVEEIEGIPLSNMRSIFVTLTDLTYLYFKFSVSDVYGVQQTILE